MTQQILHILSSVGEKGISIGALTKHIYNEQCTLFYSPDYARIYSSVQQFLKKNSQSSKSLIAHADRRGYYRLNTEGSLDARQLMIDFGQSNDKNEQEAEEQQPPIDLSLSLFD